MDSQTLRACALMAACVAFHGRPECDTGRFLSSARSFEAFLIHGTLLSGGQGVAQVGVDGLSVSLRGPRATPEMVERIRVAVREVAS